MSATLVTNTRISPKLPLLPITPHLHHLRVTHHDATLSFPLYLTCTLSFPLIPHLHPPPLSQYTSPASPSSHYTSPTSSSRYTSSAPSPSQYTSPVRCLRGYTPPAPSTSSHYSSPAPSPGPITLHLAETLHIEPIPRRGVRLGATR